MVYKQAVCTEDVFLGMGGKNPTTASCEELLVRECGRHLPRIPSYCLAIIYRLDVCSACRLGV